MVEEVKSEYAKLKGELDLKLNRIGKARRVMHGTLEKQQDNAYVVGLYNGMETIIAIIENRDPIYENLKKKESVLEKPLMEVNGPDIGGRSSVL